MPRGSAPSTRACARGPSSPVRTWRSSSVCSAGGGAVSPVLPARGRVRDPLGRPLRPLSHPQSCGRWLTRCSACCGALKSCSDPGRGCDVESPRLLARLRRSGSLPATMSENSSCTQVSRVPQPGLGPTDAGSCSLAEACLLTTKSFPGSRVAGTWFQKPKPERRAETKGNVAPCRPSREVVGLSARKPLGQRRPRALCALFRENR